MALTLITPTGAVTTTPSGIIAVRCQDYIGASAGASVVTDALSVGGDVIKEEQEIAVQTTDQTQADLWALVDDSVNIPIVDLPVVQDINDGYEILVGIRTEGDPPLNATYKATNFMFGEGGSTVGVGFGDDQYGYYSGPAAIARKHVPNYVLYDVGSWFYDAGSAELILRGWGVTGGDIAIYFDMVYMLPLTDDASNGDPQIPLTFDTNGTLVYDDDNDTTSAPWLGKYSVVNWQSPWVPPGGLVEMQEADDESTSFQTDQGANETRQSHLAYVVGVTQVDAHTVFDEDFSGSAPTTAVGIRQWQLTEGYIGTFTNDLAHLFGGGHENGFYMESGMARCYIPANQIALKYDVGGYGRCRIGLVEILENNVFPFNPDEKVATLDCQNGIFLTKVRFGVVQEAWANVGVLITPIDNAVDWSISVARLDLSGEGNLELSLVFSTQTITDSNDVTDYIMDGPVTINAGYGAEEWVWVRAERRGYTWRARAWMDGDTEPSTWDVEGIEPMVVSNSGNTSHFFVDYPWDDNWSGDTNADVMIYDPRGHNGQRLDFSGTPYPSFPILYAGVSPSLAAMITDFESYEVTFDPGTGTPGDVDTKTLKYDDSAVIDSTVTVPYGSHRVAAGPLTTRHFNIGTTDDGFNIRVWKDSGVPDLTPAIVGTVWEKFVNTLWGDIKHP